MLTPRLTNCQDCHKIPDLLKSIDCKLAELGNNMYNNVVFMLGRDVPAYTITQLIAYKRILAFKYCNPNYAGSVCVNDIASKVIRLTSGCVSRCNTPTVCEITTCSVTVIPNPSTTTTSTSSTSTSTTTSTSTSSTTTTTTSIFPDCRVDGCFELVSTFDLSCVMYSNATQDFIYNVSNNTTTAVILNNNEYGNFYANAHTNTRLWKGNEYTEIVEWIPSVVENVLTRNRTIVFKDDALGGTPGGKAIRWVHLAPVANNFLLTTVSFNSQTTDLVSLNITDDLIVSSDVALVFPFDFFSKCLMYTLDNKIITVINSNGSSTGDSILKQYSYPDGALEVSQVLSEIDPTAQVNLFQDGGKLYLSEEGGGSFVAEDKVYEVNLTTYALTLVWDNGLDYVIQPFHSSLQCNVNSLGTPQTTTTTTTSDSLVGCLQFNYTSSLIVDAFWRDGVAVPTSGFESLRVQVPPFTGATTNTTGYTTWDEIPLNSYNVVFNIGGVNYPMTYDFEDGGFGYVDVNPGKFRTNTGGASAPISDQYLFQFSKTNLEGVDNTAILSVFDEAAGDSVLVTAPGDCVAPDPDIPVTGNSYFTFWSDTSGSMDDTIEVTAKIASVTGIKNAPGFAAPAGSTSIILSKGNQAIRVTDESGGNTAQNAYLCIRDNMEAVHPSIPAGTFVDNLQLNAQNQPAFNLVDSGGNSVALTANIPQSSAGIITFNLTAAQKSADYVNTSNLRNLLQDFYATGGTEASGNTDRATNGSDEFEARVYWCHSGSERQISMLSNRGLGGTIGAAGYFPDADSLAILAFGDESGTGYNMDGDFSTGNAWETRNIQTNANIKEDIGNLRDFVEDIETAAGNTNIYRAKFFHPKATSGYTNSTIKPLVSPTGLLNAGINGADVLTSYNAGQPGQPATKPASGYGPVDNVQDFPSASPARFAWSADLNNSPANPQQYWYDEIRNALIAFGYGV